MIDRRALWLSVALIIAMTGGLIWRLSLLPDWHRMPLDGPGASHTLNSLFLFIHPLSLALATAGLYARKWFITGSEEEVRPWRHWGTLFVLCFCLLLGLMQAFIISRSLGFGLAVDRATVVRIADVATGIFLMVTGNRLPKLPWLSVRLRWFRLDPWQANRHLRFTGRLLVAMGLFFVVTGVAMPLLLRLPPQLRMTVFLAPGPLVVAASVWHRVRLRRDPSPLP